MATFKAEASAEALARWRAEVAEAAAWAAAAWATAAEEEKESISEDTLGEVRNCLEYDTGKSFPISHIDPDGAVRLAEWANLTAKRTGDYDLKVIAFVAAAMLPGVKSGWGEDGCYFIEGPMGLPASAHDPWGELYECLDRSCPNIQNNTWPFEWDGKARQYYAYEIAEKMPAIRRRYLGVASSRLHRGRTIRG